MFYLSLYNINIDKLFYFYNSKITDDFSEDIIKKGIFLIYNGKTFNFNFNVKDIENNIYEINLSNKIKIEWVLKFKNKLEIYEFFEDKKEIKLNIIEYYKLLNNDDDKREFLNYFKKLKLVM